MLILTPLQVCQKILALESHFQLQIVCILRINIICDIFAHGSTCQFLSNI